MPEVVGEEADLDKDEGEVNSMQELEPGIVEDEQQGQAHRQKAEGEGHLARVLSGLLDRRPKGYSAGKMRVVPFANQSRHPLLIV
jgi:hypothetical protein